MKIKSYSIRIVGWWWIFWEEVWDKIPDAILDINLINNELDENKVISTEIGLFSTIDLFTSATHSYNLVEGIGDNDNDKFSIDQNKLLSSEVFDYEDVNTFSVRVRSTSSNGGYFYEKSFTIKINDTADMIEDISLSSNQINENNEISSIIGEFSSVDESSTATHQYSLVSGDGDTDNMSFFIDDNKLRSLKSFDYEDDSNLSIRIKSLSSEGYFLEKKFIININDLPDAINDVFISSNFIIENNTIDYLLAHFQLMTNFLQQPIVMSSLTEKEIQITNYLLLMKIIWSPTQYLIMRIKISYQ